MRSLNSTHGHSLPCAGVVRWPPGDRASKAVRQPCSTARSPPSRRGAPEGRHRARLLLTPTAGVRRVVAHRHAENRLSHGFGIKDLVAEFRALRATVRRRWQTMSPGGTAAFQEMIRFNEAIDQVLAESVRHCASRTERIPGLFAGVLAPDLRSPLGPICCTQPCGARGGPPYSSKKWPAISGPHAMWRVNRCVGAAYAPFQVALNSVLSRKDLPMTTGSSARTPVRRTVCRPGAASSRHQPAACLPALGDKSCAPHRPFPLRKGQEDWLGTAAP
jgi:hypothetical protein